MHWAKLGAEAFLIVFSVLLALALDEWRQGIADQRLVARVQGTIHDELVRNRALIAGPLPYHEQMLKSTNGFLNQNIMEGKDGPFLRRRPALEELGLDKSKGLQAAGSLGRTGWELALNSGALEQMDYEMMVVLSETYAKQEEVRQARLETSERLASVYSGYFKEDDLGSELLPFLAAFTDMVLREREALEEYDRALAMTGRSRQ